MKSPVPYSYKIGTCRDETLIEELFGSVSEFARLVEEHGNEFVLGKVVVKYNENKDIHTFYQS